MSKITSPCQQACIVDTHTQSCSACGRTMEQISNWLDYTNDQRKQIIKTIKRKKNESK